MKNTFILFAERSQLKKYANALDARKFLHQLMNAFAVHAISLTQRLE